MWTLLLLGLALIVACGGRQDLKQQRPRLLATCFECPDDFECIGDPNDSCTQDPVGGCGGICVLPEDPGAERPDVDGTDVDETDVDETDVDETDVDETDVDETDVDETDVDETD